MQEENIDEVLIKSFIEGDESAFNRLAVRYIDKIYWHARRMTGNHPDADEILQEVLIVIYNKLNTFKFKSSLYTWIYRITNTRSINYLNKKKIRRLFSLDAVADLADDDSSILREIENKELLDKVERALQKLPVKQREVFIMRNFEQMSYEQISQITGRSIGTLKANHFHALNKIKNYLKDAYE